MKVLIATRETQGQRKNDFFWTNEGELVKLPFECDGEAVDGSCGCRRSFVGMDSMKATTTAKVVDMKIKESEFIAKFVDSYRKEGWLKPDGDSLYYATMADEVLHVAYLFEAGSVIENRGGDFRIRKGGKR